MHNLILTYRIKHDADYQRRYDSFTRELKGVCSNNYWDETSSFYALEADYSALELCKWVLLSTAFDHKKDTVVIIDVTARTKASAGAIQDPGLLDFCVGF